LVCEDTNTKVTEEPNVQEPSTSRDDKQVPEAKKPKIFQHPTLFDMFTPNHPTVASQPCSAARAGKIKIFSATEIEESTGMQKIYREFWNAKAEELCRSSALKTFKSGEIQGAINVAWTIRKTEYLKDEVEKVNQGINNR